MAGQRITLGKMERGRDVTGRKGSGSSDCSVPWAELRGAGHWIWGAGQAVPWQLLSFVATSG